jgi:hypothetical protein
MGSILVGKVGFVSRAADAVTPAYVGCFSVDRMGVIFRPSTFPTMPSIDSGCRAE